MSFPLRYSKNEVRLGYWNRQTQPASKPLCLIIPPQMPGLVLKAFPIQKNLSSERAAFRIAERAICASPKSQKPLHRYIDGSEREKMDIESKRLLQNERKLRKHERQSIIQGSRDTKYNFENDLIVEWPEYEQELWEDEFLRKLLIEAEHSIEADAVISFEEDPFQSWIQYEEDVEDVSGYLDTADERDLEYSHKYLEL